MQRCDTNWFLVSQVLCVLHGVLRADRIRMQHGIWFSNLEVDYITAKSKICSVSI